MKYFIVFLITLFISPFSLWAQNIKESVLTGTIVDAKSGEPLEQATVRLLSLPDSALIKGTVSEPNGSFSLQVRKQGKSLLTVTFIGYDAYNKTLMLPVDGGRMSLGKIQLAENELVLGEAVVEGKAPEVVVKEDTVEYNAGSYKLPPNSMVEDLIKKLPGVEIDSDGKITAAGKEVSKILVDGKEFFGNDMSVALKNINVEILNKVQVVDRKTEEARITGVDDGEQEKIINLTVKEGMKKGWFGNISGAYGNKDRYEANGNVNRFVGDNQYSLIWGTNNTQTSGGLTTAGNAGTNFNYEHNKKLRINGGISGSGSNQSIDRTTWRENLLSSNPTYYDQNYSGFSQNRNIGADMRLEWKIDSLMQLDFLPSFRLNKSNGHNENDFYTIRPDSTYVNRGNEHKENDNTGLSYSGNLILARSSAHKKGRKLSLSLNWSANINKGTSYQESHTTYGDERNPETAVRDTTVNQKQTNKEDRQSLRVRLSYVEPFANNRFFQAFYTLNSSRTLSDRYSYNYDDEVGEYYQEFDSLYSDKFKNTFLTHNINLNVRTVRTKYNYALGLSLDPSTTRSTNYFDEDRSFNRTVFNLGPTADFAYMWSKHQSLRFQYRGRTQQPSIEQLQPSKNITNPLIIREGNLDLSPSYSNSYTARYNRYNQQTQRSFQGNIQGRVVFNSITNQTTYDDATGVQVTKPVNVNGVWSIDGSGMFNTPLRNKKFQFNNNLRLSYNQQVGFTNNQKNKVRTTNVSDNIGIRYNSEVWDWGLRANYSYSTTQNSIASKKDQNTMNYGGTANVQFYLPLNITLGSDISYRGNHGYAASAAKNEWFWNAQANIQFLNKKQATAFIRAYDLLHQRSNLSRRVTTNYIEDVQSNMLTDYFLVGFSYRFNTVGQGGKGGHGGPRMEGRPGGGGRSRSYGPTMHTF